jgi:hypothetical protein
MVGLVPEHTLCEEGLMVTVGGLLAFMQLPLHAIFPLAQQMEMVPVAQLLLRHCELLEHSAPFCTLQLPSLQTLPVPQLVPSAFVPLAIHLASPLVQEIVPDWHKLVGVHELPWLQTIQLPPTQSDPAPQLVRSSKTMHFFDEQE